MLIPLCAMVRVADPFELNEELMSDLIQMIDFIMNTEQLILGEERTNTRTNLPHPNGCNCMRNRPIVTNSQRKGKQ